MCATLAPEVVLMTAHRNNRPHQTSSFETSLVSAARRHSLLPTVRCHLPAPLNTAPGTITGKAWSSLCVAYRRSIAERSKNNVLGNQLLGAGQGELAIHLAFCAQVTVAVAVKRLHYPRTLDSLPLVSEAILSDAGELVG